jgi:hypothetical protein
VYCGVAVFRGGVGVAAGMRERGRVPARSDTATADLWGSGERDVRGPRQPGAGGVQPIGAGEAESEG